MKNVHSWVVLGALAGAMVLTGCNKKGSECNALVGVINPAVDVISKSANIKGDKGEEVAKAMTTMSAALENTAASLAKVELSVAELKKFSGDYQTMCKEAAAGAKDLATLMLAAEAKMQEADKVQKSVESSMEALTKACSADKPPAECTAISAQLEKAPSDMEKTAEVQSFVAELGKIQPQDAALKGALGAVIKAFSDNQRLVTEVKELEAKSTAASAAMDKALAQEDPLVDGLNGFCKGS